MLDALNLTISLDRSSSRPLHRQLYGALRDVILNGGLAPGARLPSTRDVAGELGVSRNTVVTAFEQLSAEGFLELKVGVGTRVSDVGQSVATPLRSPAAAPGAARLGRRGQRLARPLRLAPSTENARFVSGIPDVSAFPRTAWARLLARHARSADAGLMGYAHPGGLDRLRESLSLYLRTSRGVRCTADDVIVMSSAQAGMDLATRLLVDTGDAALIEDPGYPSARAALEGAGLTAYPVPVDAEGFNIAALAGLDPAAAAARLVTVKPSHQYPTGVTMTVPRRLALLEWANRNERWIIEDDYDSEFHYDVRPIPSLQGLAESDQVIYLGTFAKTLLPALRIAYAVVPPDLAPAFRQSIRHTGQEPALTLQAALADFIEEGHFSRHLRRMRRLYGERRALLIEHLEGLLGERLKIESSSGGLQLCMALDDAVDDVAIATESNASGLAVQPLSAFCSTNRVRRGLILGFAATPEAQIADAAMRLVEILDQY